MSEVKVASQLSSNVFKQPLIFVTLTFLVSWTEQYFIIKGDGIQNPVRAFALMWTPGIVGILCSIYFDRNFKALAIRVPNFKSVLLAYFLPAFTAVLIVGLLVLFRQADFQVSPKLIEKKGGLGAALFAALIVAPTVGMLISILSGFGEEIGWRGFLHSKLLSLKSTYRYFLTGIIWSVWHWPLIIFGDYATSDKPLLNVLFFTIAITSFSFLMGWLRDNSKSSFPAALSHGSHNMWVLGISPAFYAPGLLAPYLGGESGLFCAILYLIIAVFIHFTFLRKSEVIP